VLSAWGYGDWTVLPSILGVSSSILLSGLGLSSIMSAAFPYPSVRPGDSPFSQPAGGSGTGGLVQGLSFLAILVFAAPSAFFAALAFLGSPSWHLWSLVSGLAIGIGVLLVGVTIGARVYDNRGPNLLAFAMRN
jgi:ABC-2 type transport system permease protein